MDLAREQLLACMPRCPPDKVDLYLPPLNAAMREFGIDTPARVAAFLAQLAHESGELRWWEEMPHRGFPAHPIAGCRSCRRDAFVIPNPGHEAGQQYEGRRDLGNTHPGDGVRFKGRGPIQITGRANYRAASLVLFPGRFVGSKFPAETVLEAEPERVLQPDVAFRVAGWFWASRKTPKGMSLNELADVAAEGLSKNIDQARGYFNVISYTINGGWNGAQDRWERYLRACEVLGVTTP